MTVESTPTLPPLAARLRGVQSSPVREILALTERPGMISFAGGLPAPELFDATGLAAAFAEALAGAAAGRSLQYSTTEGDPALRAAVSRAADRARAADARRRAADHERLAAGADADRDRAARAGRRRARRGAVVPGSAAGVQARRRDRRAGDVRRRRPRRRGGGRARRAPPPAAPLHDPDVPEPDRADAAARPPRGARRAPSRRRLLAARGRPLRRAALRRRGAARARGARRPRAVALDAVEDRGARPADRLGPRARGAA